MPPKKPFTKEMFEDKADLYIQGFFGTSSPDTRNLMLNKLQEVYEYAKQSGGITNEEAMKFINDKKYYYQKLGRMQDMRSNFSKGSGETKSEKWMRDYFFSGKGGYDSIMSFDQFKLGPGKDLYLRFNKNMGGLTSYWNMVRENFEKVGGENALGMDIYDFAKKYFPRKDG